MFFPGVRKRAFHPPHALVTLGLATAAIGATLAIWAAFAPSVGVDTPVASAPDISAIRSVAYVNPGPGADEIVVRSLRPGATPLVLANFPNDPFSRTHARGSASPHGNVLAILWLPPLTNSNQARLSLVDLATRERVDIPGDFDHLSPVAWAADGSRFTVVATTRMDGGVRRSEIFEVDTAAYRATQVATFEGAFEVVPVGYSYDGARRYTVVVDQTGSNLYAERNGKNERVAELSPGRTAFWSLSPDGARLAFVDILASGARTYVGRTLTLATKAITTLPADGNHFGATWMPGSPLPAFGGPGGAWQLSGEGEASGYVVPRGWAPDGTAFAATVYTTATEGAGRPTSSIEVVVTGPRVLPEAGPAAPVQISNAEGAEFLGWVADLE